MNESIITLPREELLRIIEEATKHAVEFEVCEGEQVLDKRARSWFVTMSGYLTHYVGRPAMDDVYERMGFTHLTSPKEEEPPC